MARIRGRDTGPERCLAAGLREQAIQWEEQARDLPGRPDFVFREERIVVFVDGDFWHGWRFDDWRDKLSVKWEEKIAENRKRDRRNRRLLRLAGWQVVRIWEHELENGAERCARRIAGAIRRARDARPAPEGAA